MTEYEIDENLDVRGESCPMPIVKTRQAVEKLDVGEVVEALSTDSGSKSDFDGWTAGSDDVELLSADEVEMDGETVYRFHVRKTQ